MRSPDSCTNLQLLPAAPHRLNARRPQGSGLHLGLDERIIGSAQHGLGLAKRVDFAVARLFASVVELQEPIALNVEIVDILERLSKHLACIILLVSFRLEGL